jgi:hypothetical protein
MTIHVGKIAPCNFAFGRGRRLPRTMLLISERNAPLLAASRFYPVSLLARSPGNYVLALSRYRDGRWRRDRSELTCPMQHRGKLTEVLNLLLRVRDAIPSQRTIRAVLRDSSPARTRA